MKIAKLMMGATLPAILAGGSVWAQELYQPASTRQVAFEYDRHYFAGEEEGAGESPSDVQAAETDAGSVGGGSCECGCAPCGDDCGCSGACGCGSADPWKLPQPGFLQSRGIMIGGWLQQGITFNGTHPASGFNGPVGTNDWDSEYQMNQLWLYITRPVDTGGYGWDIGGHIDLIYGTDGRFGINHGLEDRINSLSNSYGLVIPQMYLEVAVNRLSVKLGHFAGILDYEAVPAIANPFYSHSLCYAFTVPQLVTGVMADYMLTDQFSIQAGFHRGWMKFEDNNDRLDVMAGVKWESFDQRTSLAYGISSGPQYPADDQNRFVYSFVVKHQFTERFQYILVHNLGNEDDSAPGGRDAEWYGLNQYFLYTINPRWSANLRFEWLRDDDGVIVRGPPAALGIRAWPGYGYAGDFYELTCGLSWRPHPNIVVRPECRWDWYNGLAGPVGLPYDDGGSDDQFTFGVDAIVTF